MYFVLFIIGIGILCGIVVAENAEGSSIRVQLGERASYNGLTRGVFAFFRRTFLSNKRIILI